MDERKHFFDDPGNVKKVLRIFYVICAALLLADFVVHRHVYHAWEGTVGVLCALRVRRLRRAGADSEGDAQAPDARRGLLRR